LRNSTRALRRAPRFAHQRFLRRVPDRRVLCPGPPFRRARGGQLLNCRNRSRKSANFSRERSGPAPRRREALIASQCGERGEFSRSRRARRRVRGACRPPFRLAPCRPCGRWRLHRAKQPRAPRPSARGQACATKQQRKGRRSRRQQWRNPHDPGTREQRDGNQRSKVACPRDELCAALLFFDATGMGRVENRRA